MEVLVFLLLDLQIQDASADNLQLRFAMFGGGASGGAWVGGGGGGGGYVEEQLVAVLQYLFGINRRCWCHTWTSTTSS